MASPRRQPREAFKNPDRSGSWLAGRWSSSKRPLSALHLVSEPGGEVFRWLAERCSCGHTWLEHLRSGTAAQGGAQVCSVCGCPMFDVFHAKRERWLGNSRRCCDAASEQFGGPGLCAGGPVAGGVQAVAHVAGRYGAFARVDVDGHADTTRLSLEVCITGYYSRGKWRHQEYITYRTACLLAEAMDIDPYEVGI